MGFLSKIFGSKEIEEKELSLNTLTPFLKEEVFSQKTGFEKDIQSKLAEVKYLVILVKKQLKIVQNLEPKDGANPRLLKVFKTSKQKMLSQMQSVTDKLVVPETHDLKELEDYCSDAASNLKKGIFYSGKSIAYTGFLLKDQIKILGKSVSELDNIFTELTESFKKNKALLTDFDKELIALEDKQKEITALKESSKLFENKISKNKENFFSIEKQIAELNSGEDAKKLHAIEKKLVEENTALMDLKNHSLAVFSSIERPFKKLKNFAEKNPSILTHKQIDMLDTYLNDTFIALKTDLKAQKLFFLLKKLKTLVEENTIEFTEKEKNKTLESIDSLLKMDFFEEFFWKENEIKKNLKKLEDMKNSITVFDKIKKHEIEKKSLELDLTDLKKQANKQKNELKELEERLFYAKKELEESISNCTNKKITIKLY